MFYSDAQGRYRYWSTKKNGLTSIKIQMTKARMALLMTDPEFVRIANLVDVLAQGGGWYSVTAKDANYLDAKFGTLTDGAAVWIRALNTRLLSHVNANPVVANVIYVKRVLTVVTPRPAPSPAKMKRLADWSKRHAKSRAQRNRQSY